MNQHTGTPHTNRVRAALRLGELSAADLARMLWLSRMTVYRALRRLKRCGQARMIANYGEPTRWTA
jgi:DNA-binding CsgD family transcriptional regulator